jgi:peroxiredoxin
MIVIHLLGRASILLLCCLAMSHSLFAEDQVIYPLAIGSPAPDFSLPGIDGRTHSLKDYAGAKILVVIFTANHCPTAQAYEDRIIQLVRDYQEKGVAFVAISPNDPRAVRLNELGYTDLSDTLEEMKIRAKDKGFNFPYLYDGATQEVSHAYGPVSTPHAFVFDYHRLLRYQGRIDNAEKIGTATQHDVRNALDALLAGQPVPLETTKTFGCSIKWAKKIDSVRADEEKLAKEPVTLEPIEIDGVRALAKNEGPKLRLINVWAAWCGPCLVELSELVTMNRMYRQRDFELITISADGPDTRSKALALLTDKQVAARNFIFCEEDKDIFCKQDNDALSAALDKDWPGGFPYTVLIAPGGKVIHRQMGEIDPLLLKKAIIGYLGRYYK